MATVDGFTAQRAGNIENQTVIMGRVDDLGFLILYTKDGTEINAGLVRGEASMVIVQHRGDANAARPNASTVHWVGLSRPLNAQPWDFWTQVDLPI